MSYLFAFIPLLGLSLTRFILNYRHKKIRFSRKISKETAALLALILLAVALRIPCLLYPSGMMTSDDAIPALMGKHISEGKVPPVCFYGQWYMGSLSSHFFALVFKLFGYSIFVLKCATFFIFILFMAVQFYFLRAIFSFPFTLAVTLFYVPPFAWLNMAAFDNTSAYPLVLLLGTLLLYLVFLISFRGQEKWLPGLGFLIGISFWTHEITAGFILTGLLLLLLKMRFSIKKYALLFFYAVLGFLPQLLVELFHRFHLQVFLGVRKSHGNIISWDKISRTLNSTASLFSWDQWLSEAAFLVLIFLGFACLVFLSWKNKPVLPQIMFPLFFVIFYLLYLFSRFSDSEALRYFYPAYFCLPVLILAPFLVFRRKLKTALPFAFVALLFFLPVLNDTLAQYQWMKSRHLHIARTLEAMEKTGRRYWNAEYWTAYLLTAVSKERLIVDSIDVRRYLPYSLARSNQEDGNNYVFLFVKPQKERLYKESLVRWLDDLRLPRKRIEIGEGRLFYDIKGGLNPEVLLYPRPVQLPLLELKQIDPRHGYLHLTFTNESSRQKIGGSCLRVEIPRFSAREMSFSGSDKEVQIDIPYPPRVTFPIGYAAEHLGVKIPSSVQEQFYSLPQGEIQARNDSLVPLRGLGPEVQYPGGKQIGCEKEVSFELNRISSENIDLRFYLDSPFKFSSDIWYGEFSQRVRIEVNGSFLGEKELRDGVNIMGLVIPKKELQENGNIVTLKFRYHAWFNYYPFGQIAAFLNKIEVNRQDIAF